MNSAALAARLAALLPQDGNAGTALPGVTLMRADRSKPPSAVLQRPTLVFIAQGLKRGFLGDEVFHYAPGQYLVVSVPLPFYCDTVVSGAPMLALTVDIDMALVFELLGKMAPAAPADGQDGRGMAVLALDAGVAGVVERLLDCLPSPEEAAVLGPQLLRELHYRVLQGPGGACLRALAARHGKLAPVFAACETLQRSFAEPLDVATLARSVAMSASAFHKAFRQVTGMSPVQYQKALRLHRAHDLITGRGAAAAQAGFAVGYASASQFSREFKRLFGYPPSAAA
ncbi:AraC family transcriptional regulator N-terminal domain-containing protein [Pseudoduganella sp.]|uniref:AraC family transcriptional regulator n=1 Tax=Pseudoduganella sp. TaxID=1880898 RepID=UPI0035B26848